MQVLREGLNENAKRIDDDGGIAKTKTDSSNYDNPPAVEKLRILAHPRLLHAGWLTEIRVLMRRIKLALPVPGRQFLLVFFPKPERTNVKSPVCPDRPDAAAVP